MSAPTARPPATADNIVRKALGLSRFAHRLLTAEPDLLPANSVFVPFSADEMRSRLASAGTMDETELMRALRDLRKRVMLRMIVRDLGGLASLDEIMTTASTLADIAISEAVRILEQSQAREIGVPIGSETGTPQKLHVVGMGKLGGGELNVSSDIDLIFVYPEDGETRGARSMSNHEYFIRMGQRLIAMLHELTADGYVFRVDMRLRPFGGEGPLACSFSMLENYFITHGRAWERYAWIKARVICGDREAEITDLVRPFVYRRHLDYSAFDSLRELHQEIRREVERRDILDNIKLGPGGIREVEFIAQLFQLIHGGRDAALRAAPTMTVLPLLAVRNFLPPATVRKITDAYVYLRNLEHRLQYLDDRQTQTMPTNDEDCALIAAEMGNPDMAALRAQLDHHRDNVTRQFVDLFAETNTDPHRLSDVWRDGDTEQQCRLLADTGYREPSRTLARITAFRTGSRIQQMPETSRLRMEKLVPLVVETAARLPYPDDTLARMISLLESISRREAYLALLLQYPQTIERAARLASASPWAANYLARNPILLDELHDTAALYKAPEWKHLATILRRQIDDVAGDTEREMDVMRHFKHSQTMRLIAQDLSGQLALESLSDYLSELADRILSEVLRIVWRGLRNLHRDQPRFAVIGYGKLGGKELGYASDLDLIFLYQDEKPEAAENYARLAQRLNNWMTTLTAAGALYETDLRLRPDGISGLLVSSLDGYTEYQHHKAWVWEHQALTRARFVAGDDKIGHQFEAIRIEVLRQRRDLAQLRAEVVAMRDKMLSAHPNDSTLFDIKHDRGGLIDVEFIVQYLVLGYSSQFPELTRNAGNLALLKVASRLGLITEMEAQAAHDAYRRLREMQHALRLQGQKYARIDPEILAQEIAAVKRLWSSVLSAEDQDTGQALTTLP